MAKSSNDATRKTVIQALRAIQFSSHPDVQHFGMDVIEALPADEAVELCDIAVNWLTPERSQFTMTPQKIVAKWAAAGLTGAALRVTRALFQVFEHEGRLAALFDSTMYEHHLNNAIADFAKTAPLEALPVVCDLLRQASLIDGKFTGTDEVDHTYYLLFG
jgi:hypothetical protein